MIPRQQTNAAGVTIVKESEVFYSRPYLCPARVWTNGYGHTKGVTKDTPAISIETAEANLLLDLADAEAAVSRLVNVPLNANQYSALVSLVFNIGSGRFQSSTLRMRLNRGEYEAAADQFKVWRMGGGKVLPGLIIRRRKETLLFNAPVATTKAKKASAGDDLAGAITAATRKMTAAFH